MRENSTQQEQEKEQFLEENEKQLVDESEPVAAEVSSAEQVGRGRVFVIVYTTLLILAALAFVTLAVLVRGDDILRFDITISQVVQSDHQPIYAWILTHASDLGWFPGNVIAYCVVFASLFALRLRLEAVLAIASSLLAGLIGGLIKIIIERSRPSTQLIHVVASLGGYSFPSGHVIQYTTLFGFTFYVVLVVWRNSIPRDIVLVVLAALVLLVGPSRIYLGEHWPSDVLGAYLFAGLWLAGTIELHLLLVRRFAKHEKLRERNT